VAGTFVQPLQSTWLSPHSWSNENSSLRFYICSG
jgi:hypothetical protein